MGTSDTEVIVFTETNARILKNPSPDAIACIHPKFVKLTNPVRESLAGIPPHYWKPIVSENKVVPMDASEKRARDKAITEHGVNNRITAPQDYPNKPKRINWRKVIEGTIAFGIGMGAAALMHALI